MHPPAAEPNAEPELGDLLMQVSRRLRRQFAESVEPLGLAPHQARALHVICAHDTARLSDIAAHLRIAPRSATEVVDSLQEKGLVERRPDPHDRRAVLVVPTDAGTELSDAIGEQRAARAEHFFAPLDPRERRTLGGLLQRLLAD